MTKQITYYNIQFGIDDKVPAQENFDRQVREKHLLLNFEHILLDIAKDNDLSIGDIISNLELAVLQGDLEQHVIAQGDISVKSIHHIKDSAGFFRQAFNKLIVSIKEDTLITKPEDPEHLFQQLECECDTVCKECDEKK